MSESTEKVSQLFENTPPQIVFAFLSIANLCVANYSINNRVAQMRAKGMLESLDIICEYYPELPVPNLKYLRSLSEPHPDHPNQDCWSIDSKRCLRLALGLDADQMSQLEHRRSIEEAKCPGQVGLSRCKCPLHKRTSSGCLHV